MIAELLNKYHIHATGLVHVGAHEGQEVEEYMTLPNVILIEPIPKYAKALRQLGHFEVRQFAAWDSETTLTLHITKNDQGSSVLKPLEHAIDETLPVLAKPLYTIVKPTVNVAVIDVQGAEMYVLRGANLQQFNLLVVETSRRIRYQDAPEKAEVVKYLTSVGFTLREELAHSEDKIIEDLVFTK